MVQNVIRFSHNSASVLYTGRVWRTNTWKETTHGLDINNIMYYNIHMICVKYDYAKYA